MSNQKRSQRVTAFRGKPTDVRGYANALELVKWLNLVAPQRLPAYAQTVRLMELLNLARAQAVPMRDEIDLLLRPLCGGVSWRLIPRLTPEGGGTGWQVAMHYPLHLRGLYLAASLSAHGLEWVRQCKHCGAWLLTYNRRNRYCTVGCKKAFEAEQRRTPEGRKRWRLYMRDLRATKARLKKKALLKRNGP